jgi:hypothetical protein
LKSIKNRWPVNSATTNFSFFEATLFSRIFKGFETNIPKDFQMKNICQIFAVTITLVSSTFSFQDKPEEILRQALKPVREKYAPDRRTAVFDIALERRASTFVIKGEVDNPAAKAEALKALRTSFTGELLDSIRILPDASLGDKTFGIVTLSVGNVRSKPGNAEELATQVLMGMVVKLLKRESGYYYIQSSDQYLGWLDDDAMVVTNRSGVDGWVSAPKVIATGLFGIVREKPDANAAPVCDLVTGGILKSLGAAGSWINVELADGRRGYIEKTFVEDYESWKASRKLTGENVEKSAKLMVGFPYLWGGTSIKGMDCSGFTKTVFRMNGLELNRDANQQALMGEEVNPGENFQNLRKGDLLFFGRKGTSEKPERITHVAIYLENKGFIHSSGRVKLGSFDPSSPNYDEGILKRFVRARRVIPTTQAPELRKSD